VSKVQIQFLNEEQPSLQISIDFSTVLLVVSVLYKLQKQLFYNFFCVRCAFQHMLGINLFEKFLAVFFSSFFLLNNCLYATVQWASNEPFDGSGG